MPTFISAPKAPTNVTATRNDDSQAHITWTRNPESDRPYDSQRISRWDNVSNAYGDETTLSGTDNDRNAPMGANRRYRWRVRAKNEVGFSDFGYSNYLQTTPGDPYSPSVTWTSPTSAVVQWGIGATGNGYVYTTEIFVSVNGGGWTLVAEVGAGVGAWGHSGMTPGSTYQYQIRHKSTVSGTLYSAGVFTPVLLMEAAPAAPSAFTAVRNSDASMTLTWTDNPTGSAPYSSLTVQRWDSASNAWNTVGELSPTATSLTDTGAVANRKYQYQIRANNRGGSSSWVQSGFLYTTPSAPQNATALYVTGNSITVSWENTATYTEYGLRVQPVKDGVAQTTVTVAGGSTSYTLTGADPLATYTFNVWAVSNVGALASASVASNQVRGAAAPNAPINVKLAEGEPIDFTRSVTLVWQHSPSQDMSAMTKFQYRHRPAGNPAWTESAIITGTDPSKATPWPAGTYANGTAVEFQVRTWGIHADPSPYSATSTANGRTTPTLSLNTPTTVQSTSLLIVDWDFLQAQGSVQAEWKFDVTDTTTGTLIESRQGADTTDHVTVNAAVEHLHNYELVLSARAANGMWTDVLTKSFSAFFVPPAESVLIADLDSESGAVVLTLNPTEDDGGVTTRPAVSVDIERRLWDEETESYGDWEPVALGVAPNATIIDTTAPIHGEGEYRATTYSDAPSSYRPPANVPPSTVEAQWAYLSAGPQFDVVARMWANINVSWTSSRSKALHYFAGRKRPVIYSGESAEKTLNVTGIITAGDGASPPKRWIYLAQQEGAVLFRAPGGVRIYGSLSEVSIERIENTDLHQVSFNIQEVYKP